MRPITDKELCRRLDEAGWALKRIKESHHIIDKAGEWKIITVAVHDNQIIKPGLAAASPKTPVSPGEIAWRRGVLRKRSPLTACSSTLSPRRPAIGPAIEREVLPVVVLRSSRGPLCARGRLDAAPRLA
jgi:predicted RNA binding protein YcfA (HicA-like mRNA interferase family)